MATLAFGIGGAAIAGAVAGSTASTAAVIAGLTATQIGFMVGSAIGGVIDSTIVFPMLMGSQKNQSGSRLDSLKLSMASEGTPINRVFGPECRVAANIIFLPDLVPVDVVESSGGKQGSSIEYQKYYADFIAMWAWCPRSPISRVRKIWADSKLIWDDGPVENQGNDVEFTRTDISVKAVVSTGQWYYRRIVFNIADRDFEGVEDLRSGATITVSGFTDPQNNGDFEVLRIADRGSMGGWDIEVQYVAGASVEVAGASITIHQEGVTGEPFVTEMRHYLGTSSQLPDPTYEASRGVGNTPAYRYRAYTYFEGFATRDFGNRIPSMNALIEEAETRTVASIISDIMLDHGYDEDEFDVSTVVGDCKGYVVAGAVNGIKAIEPLLVTYNIGVREENSKLFFFMRANSDTFDVTDGDLGCHEPGATGYPVPGQFTDVAAVSLPAQVFVSFYEPDQDWQRGTQGEKRRSYVKDSPQVIDLAVTMDADEARAIAKRLLWTAWVEQRRVRISLPPSYFTTQEGDFAVFSAFGQSYTMRADTVDIGYNLRVEIEGPIIQTQTTTQIAGAESPGGGGTATIYTPPLLIPIIQDIPAIADSHTTITGYYYGTFVSDSNRTWRNGTMMVSTDDATFSSVSTITQELTAGFTTAALGSASPGMWDYANTLEIDLVNGTLSSKTEAEVLAGSNWACVGGEIIAFCEAEALGESMWRISKLLRGLRGSENWIDTHSATEDFIVLSASPLGLAPLSFPSLSTDRYWRAVPDGGLVEDAFSVEVELTGRTIHPFAPTDLTASRDGSNNITYEWVRRTRAFFDEMSGLTPPLLETAEYYEIDVLDGSDVVVRTITASAVTTATYSAANQTTDGFTPGDPIKVRIYMKDPSYTRGGYLEATL